MNSKLSKDDLYFHHLLKISDRKLVGSKDFSYASSHPHLQALCDSFLSTGWNKVAHYKEAFNLGLAVC